ncbi:MAG: hypothetical protein H7Z42_01995 [Roseiflexaceae bacterium]|nr:hypothetical protein [Roseiflexaceae bacterium]
MFIVLFLAKPEKRTTNCTALELTQLATSACGSMEHLSLLFRLLVLCTEKRNNDELSGLSLKESFSPAAGKELFFLSSFLRCGAKNC